MKKIMAKLIAVFSLAFIMIAFTTGCGNYEIFDWNYTFDTAIVTFNGKIYEFSINKWNDYEGEQIQLTLKDGTVMVVNSENLILYNKSETDIYKIFS